MRVQANQFYLFYLLFVRFVFREVMIVHQLGHFQAIGSFFHVDQEAESADRIGFEILQGSVPTQKEGLTNKIQDYYFVTEKEGHI